jgi:hypothetical protein
MTNHNSFIFEINFHHHSLDFVGNNIVVDK